MTAENMCHRWPRPPGALTAGKHRMSDPKAKANKGAKTLAWAALAVLLLVFAAFTVREGRRKVTAKPLHTPIAPKGD